ncbi:MAG: OsmC family protein [Flavobacteriaceae bacterium]|jgi:putative redox protein|uniref:OsmC family protein n=1 Tax=Candidatus Arcticimaribacter forsetii TaxID=2820661 RepID=UPI002076EF37|nr:OsmC family protein [Candidatus Arcticimaribacter forsetii]MCH1539078.1 OsmC family protein [Flavobacteriaceae bacterium]MDB4608622.1 OsmC family protein [Flavobacteriaceae bacterium]MDB4620820.1 OsmC family protein [Flavobacteriaceae bacterium]MDB4715030.1 OsmC family protein [Flavobacteriaceae bacterium]MDB4751071.1 OsmC family protein [Flavobacteriaceae bacterium]
MKISLNRINEDYLFEATSSNGMNVLLDNKSKKEGKVEGISPMEVLLMGVAGCSSIDVVAILNKQRINPVTLRMEVEGVRDPNAVPAPFQEINVSLFLEGEDISPEKAKRAAQLSFDKYCSVSKSLDPNIKINQIIFVNGEKV